SNVFVFEADISPSAMASAQQTIAERAYLPAGQTLRNLLSPKALPVYLDVVNRAGLNPDQLDHYRPWLVRLQLLSARLKQSSTQPLSGVDTTITDYARSYRKELRFLETAQQQIDLLTSSDLKSDLADFETELSQASDDDSRFQSLLTAWSGGDEASL